MFFQVAIMIIKLHNTDFIHYIHKKFVVYVCKFNDGRENMITFFLNFSIVMCMGYRKINKIDPKRLMSIA